MPIPWICMHFELRRIDWTTPHHTNLSIFLYLPAIYSFIYFRNHIIFKLHIIFLITRMCCLFKCPHSNKIHPSCMKFYMLYELILHWPTTIYSLAIIYPMASHKAVRVHFSCIRCLLTNLWNVTYAKVKIVDC